jgi:(E)-4-hydroxy-3-methylbut-2-enyl-diphosphate synthase
MIYMAGKAHHKLSNDGMIEHIVELVEAKAEEMRAAKAEDELATAT